MFCFLRSSSLRLSLGDTSPSDTASPRHSHVMSPPCRHRLSSLLSFVGNRCESNLRRSRTWRMCYLLGMSFTHWFPRTLFPNNVFIHGNGMEVRSAKPANTVGIFISSFSRETDRNGDTLPVEKSTTYDKQCDHDRAL